MITNAMDTHTSLYEEVSAAHPNWSDKRIVQAICTEMLDEAEASPPVDVHILASLCGIENIEYRSDGPAGMLVCRDERWIASVLESDGLERQRFTILHEGGHTFQPDFQRGGSYHRCKGPRTRVEQLCDLAAAEMLFPRRHFSTDLAARGPLDLAVVGELAQSYCASQEATTRRAIDLYEGTAAMMVFHFAYKPADQGYEHLREPKLRLQYAYSAGNLPYHLQHKSAAEGSLFMRAWQYELVDEGAEVDSFFIDPVGPAQISARRYGEKVIALIRLPSRKEL